MAAGLGSAISAKRISPVSASAETVRTYQITSGFRFRCSTLLRTEGIARDPGRGRSQERRSHTGQMRVWTCTAVPKSKEEEPGGCKGRKDMRLLISEIYEKYKLVGRTVQKVEMGAEHPLSTPHLRVSSPPKHAPSTPPTILENRHDVS